MDVDRVYLAESLKNIYFEIDKRNIEELQNLRKVLANKLRTTRKTPKKLQQNSEKSFQGYWCSIALTFASVNLWLQYVSRIIMFTLFI